MVTAPALFTAQVMHSRLFPKKNIFGYGLYYLVLPLPAPAIKGLCNSFDPADIGPRDGSDPLPWVRAILDEKAIGAEVAHITLVTMPRVFGYVFNPVSFYFCFNQAHALIAVLCEVHNTFGEQHSYLCVNEDLTPITPQQWLSAEKLFHVSPFLERAGRYTFRFDVTQDRLGIWIDFYDAAQQRQLITSLTGSLEPLDKGSLQKAFWLHPLVPLKAIILIHWQALKLIVKGIRHLTKPEQKTPTVTTTKTSDPVQDHDPALQRVVKI
jgi:DUF1365 family protein